MVDYEAHLASLRLLEAELQALLAGNPNAELHAVEAALAAEPSYAALGSLVDHLFEHVSDSDREITLLKEAVGIWRDVLDMLATVAQVRQQLETLVLTPAQPDVVDQFNNISTQLSALQPSFNQLTARLQALFVDLQALDHIPQHGQEHDVPTVDWSWRDKFLSRGTGSFVHNLIRLARLEGSDRTTAFAYGAAASYSANAVGSAYMNQTVRGSRRSHPIRDRLASYSLGAWLRTHQAALTPGLPEIRNLIHFGAPHEPKLPGSIAKLLDAALDATYGGKLGAHPDLANAYGKLIEHLDLMNSFPLPPMPQPINATLWSKVVTLHPESADGGGPPDGTTTGAQQPSSGSSSTDIPWWEWVLFAVCVIAVALCYAFGVCSTGNSNPFPDPTTNDPNGVGQAEAYLTSDAAYVKVNELFNAHVELWQLASYGLKVLKLLGLVYPDSSDLNEPQFAQFTSIPTGPFAALRRPISDPNLFLGIPASALENPVSNIAPYPAGASPLAVLVGAGSAPGVSTFGLNVLRLEAIGNGSDSELRRRNLNLDADRGFTHPCWRLKAGSIAVDPLSVEVLAYSDVV